MAAGERARVAEAAQELGFELAGVASVAPSARLAGFSDWIGQGRGGAKEYMERRGEGGSYLREQVLNVWPWARSIVAVAKVYNAPLPRSTERDRDAERGWISRYAWGDDYHETMRGALEELAQRLVADTGAQFKTTLDTAPIVERDVGVRAGLGWQGKNTCLIHPRLGSYFFLGTIVTSLELESALEQVPDRCGTCTRCIEACPTEALTPYAMDASRCIAYLNIELRGTIPEALRAPMGDNVLGCDICQDVCPWNRRAAVTEEAAFQPREGLYAPLLESLAAMTEEEYREKFRRSAVKRAKYTGLMRNLAVAMGNSGDPRHRARLERWTAGEDATVAEHARWALARLDAEKEETP